MIKMRINLRQIETNLYIINNNSTTIYIDENELDYNNKCNLNHKIIYNLIKDIKTNYKENDKEKDNLICYNLIFDKNDKIIQINNIITMIFNSIMYYLYYTDDRKNILKTRIINEKFINLEEKTKNDIEKEKVYTIIKNNFVYKKEIEYDKIKILEIYFNNKILKEFFDLNFNMRIILNNKILKNNNIKNINYIDDNIIYHTFNNDHIFCKLNDKNNFEYSYYDFHLNEICLVCLENNDFINENIEIYFYKNNIDNLNSSINSLNEPLTKSSNEPLTKSSNELLNEPLTKSSNELLNEPLTKSSNELLNEPTIKSSNEPIIKSSNEPIIKSSNEPIIKSSNEPINEPITKSSNEPLTKSSNEPINEPITKSSNKPINEPTIKSSNEPIILPPVFISTPSSIPSYISSYIPSSAPIQKTTTLKLQENIFPPIENNIIDELPNKKIKLSNEINNEEDKEKEEDKEDDKIEIKEKNDVIMINEEDNDKDIINEEDKDTMPSFFRNEKPEKILIKPYFEIMRPLSDEEIKKTKEIQEYLNLLSKYPISYIRKHFYNSEFDNILKLYNNELKNKFNQEKYNSFIETRYNNDLNFKKKKQNSYTYKYLYNYFKIFLNKYNIDINKYNVAYCQRTSICMRENNLTIFYKGIFTFFKNCIYIKLDRDIDNFNLKKNDLLGLTTFNNEIFYIVRNDIVCTRFNIFTSFIPNKPIKILSFDETKENFLENLKFVYKQKFDK